MKTEEGGSRQTDRETERQRRDGFKRRRREAVMLLDRKEDSGSGEKMETNDAGSRSGLMGTL